MSVNSASFIFFPGRRVDKKSSFFIDRIAHGEIFRKGLIKFLIFVVGLPVKLIQFHKDLQSSLSGSDLVMSALINGYSLKLGSDFLHDLLTMMREYYFILFAAE